MSDKNKQSIGFLTGNIGLISAGNVAFDSAGTTGGGSSLRAKRSDLKRSENVRGQNLKFNSDMILSQEAQKNRTLPVPGQTAASLHSSQ